MIDLRALNGVRRFCEVIRSKYGLIEILKIVIDAKTQLDERAMSNLTDHFAIHIKNGRRVI